jgi:hypothetical protein
VGCGQRSADVRHRQKKSDCSIYFGQSKQNLDAWSEAARNDAKAKGIFDDE